MVAGALFDDDNNGSDSGAVYVFQEAAVTVSRAGSGSGTVTSNPAGIDCGSDCSETYPFGTFITLTPSPAVGSIFGGWGGDCSGVETETCAGNLTRGTASVTATFTITTRTLTVSHAGSGSGTVTSNPAGIDCGSDCSEAYAFGTPVTLTAAPAAGSIFGGWGGACSGTGTCEVTMTAARSVTATFTITTRTLTVSGAGSGSGTVTSNPAGIDCGSECSEAYTYGTPVTLTASPAAGSTFGGWGGACSGTGTCEVTMTAARSVTATFNLTAGTLQFSSAAYSVTEPSGSALVTVTRTGGSAGAIAVTFATSDGTVTAGSDYAETTATVSWADGETASKTVNVEILDDKVVEADETVHLTLSTPTGGATLGTPSEADLTILDDDDGAVIGLGPGGGGRMDEVSLSAPHARRDRFSVPWNACNTANGETRPVFCNLDGEGHHELVVGLGPGGGGWVEVRERLDDGDFAHQAWTGVPFSTYNTANGETRPACGDLDGDGRDEIVIGLGPGARGILEIRDDALANFAHLAWIQVPWAAYDNANGETFPAVGDLDGDGRAEIVIGLGAYPANGGWVEVREDAAGGYAHLDWIRVPFPDYNAANGEVHPVTGDLDGDGSEEIVLGLGTYTANGGWVQVREDAAGGYNHLTWIRVLFSAYNDANGATWPATGDVDGDNRDEILLGLGAYPADGGWFEFREDAAGGFAHTSWGHVDDSAEGETRPAAVRAP